MNTEQTVQALLTAAAAVIRGKEAFLELLTAGLLGRGHVLIEDRPGLGKTTAAKTFARLIGTPGQALTFKRIQGTPDLLPYDITGVDIFDPETRAFRFVPGPVFANIVLADELNRTTPKVQSALLEVMAERQVTIGTATHALEEPFFVIATENPLENEGTFPLPAAQVDRFMLRLSMGYPEREAELSLLESNPAEIALEPVISTEAFLEAQVAAAAVFCHKALKEAITDIVRETRTRKEFTLGVSPRGGLHYLSAAKALALVRGRDFVTDEDITALAVPVLAHRVKPQNPGLLREICLERLKVL